MSPVILWPMMDRCGSASKENDTAQGNVSHEGESGAGIQTTSKDHENTETGQIIAEAKGDGEKSESNPDLVSIPISLS